MSAPAQLIASLATRYRVEGEIGRGGMATVYLAHDIRHERRVALKVLSPELGAVLGSERFLAEIRVTANLQHPNLLPLFDSGEVDGLLFYVMPYVEGESLRARLDRERQLPIDDALRIAMAIASALDYAHRQGVIHRDLKPENILLHDGQPLVADFGIALAVSNAGGGRITQTGLSLGTPQYMSPEQATGDRAIDARTDIYSLAAVTYEMLTGEPPHAGGSAQAIIAKLMTEEPRPITVLRRAVPAHVDAAVRCGLEKLAADRFPTASQFADALSGRTAVRSTSASAARSIPSSRRSRLVRWATIALVIALAALAAYGLRPRASPMMQFIIDVPRSGRFVEPAPTISPDGRFLAFIAADSSGLPFLWIRPLDRLAATRLPGTEDARLPFWSPDSKALGFFADRKLKAIALADAAPRTVCDAPAPSGGSWNADDVIIFGPDLRSPLYRVSAEGGQPTRLTTLGSPSSEQWYPSFLSDGKHFVFLQIAVDTAPMRSTVKSGPRGEEIQYSAPQTGIFLGSLDGSDPTRLSPALAVPVVSPANDLLVVGENGLTTQSIDVGAARLVDTERVIAPDVAQAFSFDGAPVVTVSRNGTLVYRVGGEQRKILVWVDRSGQRLETVTPPGNYRAPAISPDQSKIAVGRDGDIWVIDRARANAETRLTVDSTVEVSPVWSPDGRQIAFSSFRGSWRLYVKSASGTGPEVELADAGTAFAEPFDWSRDGKYLSYFGTSGTSGEDIYIVSMGGMPKPERLIATRFTEVEPRFSPDGKWIVYVSNESRRYEIYVQSLPLSDVKVQISANGGMQPIWSADGSEIFFLGLDGRVMSAAVSTAPRFTAGVPRALFQSNANVLYTHNSYAPGADGKRFLVATFGGTEAPALAVVTNWRQLLRPAPVATR